MPGVVDKINVKVGDKVQQGDPVIVIIAMKMEVSTSSMIVYFVHMKIWFPVLNTAISTILVKVNFMLLILSKAKS